MRGGGLELRAPPVKRSVTSDRNTAALVQLGFLMRGDWGGVAVCRSRLPSGPRPGVV